MKFKLSAIAAAVAAATLSTAASAAAIDFHGYMRAGVGSSMEGGKQTCFKLNGAYSKYRLGNECENYGEFAFDVDAWKSASSETFAKLHTRIAYSVSQNKDYETTEPAFRESWVEFGNIGSGALAKAKLWAGKRFYQRHDIHMTDFYWWDNSGPGAGIEDVQLGPVKLSYAYRQNGNTDGNPEQEVVRSHDFRGEFGLGDYGVLELGLDYKLQDNRGAADQQDRDDGYLLTARHFMGGVLGGFNEFGLQYGQGAGENLVAAYPNPNPGQTSKGNDKSSWRIVDQLVFDFGAVNGQATFVYQDQKDNYKWMSFGVRPVYHFNELYSVAAEYGYDQVKPAQDGLKTAKLQKFTIAGQISAGKSYWARPVIRAFYTYAFWNDAVKDGQWGGLEGGVQNVYAGDTSGSTYGVQAEMWW